MEQQHPPSPMQLLEILEDRFAPEDELAMDLLVAGSVLEFGRSLREARDGAMVRARARGVAPLS